MTNVNANTIRDVVSYYQGVNPARNVMATPSESSNTTRRLQNTTTYTMVWTSTLSLDRRVASPTTATIASLGTADKALIQTDVTTALPSGSTYSGYDPAAYTIAQSSVNWTTAPDTQPGGLTDTSVILDLQSDNANGEIACIAELSTAWDVNTKPTGEQIYLGLNRNNAAPQASAKVNAVDANGDATTSITINGLSSGTLYSVWCTATNGVATFPGYVTYATDDSYTPVTATTLGEVDDDETDDYALLASSNVVSVFLMIAALIFN